MTVCDGTREKLHVFLELFGELLMGGLRATGMSWKEQYS